MRIALTALAALTAVLAAPAAATGCPLVTDPAGDTAVVPQVPVADPAGDILSADFASDADEATAVVRVRDLDDHGHPSALGGQYDFHLRVPVGSQAVEFRFRARRSFHGEAEAWVSLMGAPDDPFGEWVGDATAVFDETANEIRITAPTSVLRSVVDIDVYDVADRFRAVSHGQVDYSPAVDLPPGGGTFSDQLDSAEGSGTYTLGSAGCIVPGA